MLLSLQQPFPLSLTLLEQERRYGSSHFRLDLAVTRFDEHLCFNAKIWLANDAWDNFLSQLSKQNSGNFVLYDMSKDFQLYITQNENFGEIGLEIAARHIATPDVRLIVHSTDLELATLDSVRRAFLTCERWWG